MKLFIPVLICLTGLNAHAQQTGAEFLKIDSAARAVSMGSAYTATVDGINSLGYNPAGLASISGLEVGFNHTIWLMDSKHDVIGVGLPLGSNAVSSGLRGGLGVVRLSNSDIEVRNADRSAGGSFSSYDQAVTFGLARGQSGGIGWGMGISVKYIESSIAGERASAVAADLGLTRALRAMPITLGVSAQNIGTPMKYISQKDPLPLTLAGGLAARVIPGFNLAMDIKHSVYDKGTTVSIGSEYAVISAVSLRTGYMRNKGFKNKIAGLEGNFSAGAGLKFWGMDLDYAMQAYGELGDTQKISIRKKF